MHDERTKVLIVDDETEVVDTLRHFLDLKGYETRGSYDAEGALSILEKEKIDLILLDLMLPGISGQEAVQIIRSKYPSVKIVIVTAYGDEGQRLFKEERLAGVFIKPMGIQQLYSRLKEIITSLPGESAPVIQKESIKARLFLIKAKLLILEPCLEIYNMLKDYFKSLSEKGQIYQLDNAVEEDDIRNKIAVFHPEVLIINMAVFNSSYFARILELVNNNPYIKEIIVYNLSKDSFIKTAESEKLAKAVQLACLKNGLVEIRLVEL